MDNVQTTTARPDILHVNDLLDSVLSGEVRVPRFQRPYIWSTDDMIQLFDSVIRGYPIGTLLMWQTDRADISSLPAVGPIEVPAVGPPIRSYVIDGHQRLATLLGVLRLPESYPRDSMDSWRWWIAYDLENEQFVHIKDRSPVIPLHLLPLRSVLKTVDFARRTRELVNSQSYSERQVDELLNRADSLQRVIREYRVPITVMRSSSLDDAVTIFARVNQRGRDMTPDQMVSALTFRDAQEGAFDLAASIDEILGELREFGFGDLQRRIVLQMIMAIAGLDFTRNTYDRIVNRNSHLQLRPAVERTASAVGWSARFLREMLGVKTSRLLPYASIIVLLAIYFDELAKRTNSLTEGHSNLLQKWFWATSFNGWFAGANSTEMRRAGEIMRSLANDVEGAEEKFGEMFFGRAIRQFPKSYDSRSARVRASLLVQIIAGQPRDPATGAIIDASAVFSDVSSREIPYFFPKQGKPTVSSPANRVILPTGYSRNARATFVSAGLFGDDAILASHFISASAFAALAAEQCEDFITLREATILEAERRFLAQFQLDVNQEVARNQDEIDSDE